MLDSQCVAYYLCSDFVSNTRRNVEYGIALVVVLAL